MCSSVVIDANILQVVAYISVVNIPPGMIECQLNDLSCWGENVDLLQRGSKLNSSATAFNAKYICIVCHL